MKTRLALIALCALLAFSGCSQQPSSGFSQEDLVLNVSDNTYRCGDDIQTVVADLGEGYEYAEGKSCAYDGLDKTYSYPQAEFYTNPLEEGDMLTEIYTEDPSVTTSKGIAVGATRQEVEDAYGQPDEDDGYTLTYRVSDEAGEPALCFDMENDTVIAIFLTRGLI